MKKKHFSLKKYWFTLIELVFVAMIIALIMPEMFSLYNFIIRSNREIIARQSAIQQWYEFFERLNILMEDYTIDYEEYYNRNMVWCSTTRTDPNISFSRDVWLSWYCTNFTAYGNENNIFSDDAKKKYHDIYYCSSIRADSGGEFTPKVVKSNNCGNLLGKQSYGQYAALFKDVKGANEVWWETIIVWTDDDEELWDLVNRNMKSIDAIGDFENVQELYLISHDWDRRLYFRRKLDKIDESWKYKQYKIQMLRLRWFDAWRMHDFSKNGVGANNRLENKWLYDWVIDTWACDTSMWFIWSWASIGGAYADYRLPYDQDDCWVDLTHWTTDLFSWNLSISPKWDPSLYWANETHQINPYMRIMILNKIYFPGIAGNHNRMSNTVDEFSVPLETTINMKDFYKENR